MDRGCGVRRKAGGADHGVGQGGNGHVFEAVLPVRQRGDGEVSAGRGWGDRDGKQHRVHQAIEGYDYHIECLDYLHERDHGYE